jgi:hypothetical protein
MDRKATTRHKIQLGGLVTKAGLGNEKPTTLYGLLLEASETLRQEGEDARLRWQIKGELAFKEA